MSQDCQGLFRHRDALFERKIAIWHKTSGLSGSSQLQFIFYVNGNGATSNTHAYRLCVQGMEHQYAQIATEIHAAEVMTYNTCRLKENGLKFVKEASMAKLFASQVAEKAASKSIEWLGGVGFTQNLMVEKFFRDCKVGSIYEGTSNIQLQTIAKRIKDDYQ